MGFQLMDIQPVILAGGSGTRLWPLSRSSYPKQFLPFMDGASLLDLTLTRMVAIAANELSKTPIVICNKDNRFFVAEHFRQAGLENASIMLEPCGRNTAPALTMAALHIADQSDDAVMFVTPSDHLINDTASFNKSAVNAIKLASEGHIVTLGISPTGPETGFGYIKMGEAWGASVEVPGYRLDSFVEKPDLPTAQKYLDSNQYLWNAGVFVLKASIWLENIKTYAPEIHSRCVEAFSSSRKESDFYWIDEGAFSCCPADSIDYAVMEKLSRVDSTQPPLVIPLETGWSDLGSWASYWEVQNKDDSGNALKGDALAIDTCNSLLFSSSRLVATVGVKDLIVVETKDAVLISDKNKTQQVSAIVKHLKKHNREEIKTHSKVHRPWGTYDTVDSGDRFIVKRIVVKPGAALSLQMHHHRAEHWVVVKGTARVTRGEDVFLLSENESTYISIGQKHRLENPGTTPLEIIEVQSGGYLEEDDIVRFDDIYNRGNVQ
jgi:mannose-1-phosphate guanylyltransferase/mannose-6-phosphate isomerase